jgi:endonuclease III
MSKALIRKVSTKLAKRHGTPSLSNKRHLVSELVFIVLSARTRGREHEKAYRRIRRRFRTWTAAMNAPLRDLQREIAPAGLERVKAAQIKGLLRKIQADFGTLESKRLHGLKNSDVEDYLTSLPGVGLKTARCVLMYALDRDVFPVDTHCLRLFENLGLVKPGLRLESAQEPLQDLVPPDIRRSLHINAVAHGRETCIPGAPKCHICVLATVCRSPAKRLIRKP